ncbi:hypothetical protein [Chryseobacterium sp. SIMBA_028]|uniref:hypothetical protein n=1 Tax=Chryseobacterium sp. SIMBA_028 TaxID=3085771 RepID=UPI00397CF925
MDSKQFRIGNYINFGSTLSEITGVMAEEIMFKYNTGGEDRYALLQTPGINLIPISEEWLLKFGFLKVLDHPVYRLDGIQIEFNGVDSEWAVDLFSGKTDVDYIHQLQNIFFAIKGKELTLK